MKKTARNQMSNPFILVIAVTISGAFLSLSQPIESSCPGSNDTPPSTETIYDGTDDRDYIIVGMVQVYWPGWGWIDAGIGICRFDMDASYNKGDFTDAQIAGSSSTDVYYVKGGLSEDLIRWAYTNYETCGTDGLEVRIGKDVGSSYEGEPKKLYIMGEADEDKLYVCASSGSSMCWINDTNPDCTVRYVADGGSGDDWVYGGSLDDYLLGGDGADTLSGSSGADCIYGQGGNNDTLWGGSDLDYLDGGSGSGDSCNCGGNGTDANCESFSSCDDTAYPCVY